MVEMPGAVGCRIKTEPFIKGFQTRSGWEMGVLESLAYM